MNEQEIVAMISGPQWVSQKFYNKHYLARLFALAAGQAKFVVGAADGVDTYAQKDLARLCENGLLDPQRVTVFNKGDKDGRVHPDFLLCNGFRSYPERDRAMCDVATELICKLPQFGGASGGTALNVLRFAFGGREEQAQIAHKALRSYSERFDSDQKRVVLPRVEEAYDAVYAFDD